MKNNKVFVVFKWDKYWNSEDEEVLGIFYSQEKAKKCLKAKYDELMENYKENFNVEFISHEHLYAVIELKEKKICLDVEEYFVDGEEE